MDLPCAAHILLSNACMHCIYNRAGGNGPTAPVLAGPVFLKAKMKFNFCKKQLMNESASVIFMLFGPIILSCNR